MKEKMLPRGVQIRGKKFFIDWEGRPQVQPVEDKGTLR
jgi:hypothetical protein